MGNAKSKAGEHQQEEDVATGQASGKNVEEYSATFDTEKDEAICATEPAPTSETNLKEYNPSILTVAANLDPIYTTETDGSEWVRPGYHADGQTFAATANLSLDHAINKMQLRDDTEDDTASELLETVSLNNECKKYAEEAREQYNARRRAAYRKKNNEDIVSLQDENQPVLAKSGEVDG
ncbi:uncharacterized protein [Aegilops tauschii subsp. strangulata]|uniref:uncharacterized protein n=1 Tax=Aegilops tauschii subsp. strangulata TaxID=200361 RepID=UPI001ABD0C85|nr:uncharacterized protein LOC109785215 [Aegilops tauschii subsp. strangulata]